MIAIIKLLKRCTWVADTVKGKLQLIISNGIDLKAGTNIIGKVKINDGTEDLLINTDGSINVKSDAGNPIISATRSAGATPYDANDVIGNATTSIITFTNVSPYAGGYFFITNLLLKITTGTKPAGMGAFRLHLYDSLPTNITDNAAWTLGSADSAKYKGYIDIDSPTDIGDILFTQMTISNFVRKLASASTSFYGILQTLAGYTPTSECIKTIELQTIGV